MQIYTYGYIYIIYIYILCTVYIYTYMSDIYDICTMSILHISWKATKAPRSVAGRPVLPARLSDPEGLWPRDVVGRELPRNVESFFVFVSLFFTLW